ncbi:MAG: acyl-CoA dehydratase activase [Planctomycetota bacterium]|nr:acyl-CoA dehydratase activase [Planctomycetota bacterium]
MVTCGIDVGARTTKAVIVAGGRILAAAVEDTGADPATTARHVFDAALAGAAVAEKDVAKVVATGYGRGGIAFASTTVTEITCQARGVQHLVPGARGILDVGGQDSKAIALDEEGRVRDFLMNDRCAAGTGRFLEVMAGAFGVSLQEASRMALAAAAPVAIASTCTVFAESEVVSLRAHGRSSADILAGVHAAVAARLKGMADRIAMEGPVVFTGGAAMNEAAVEAVRRALSLEVRVPENPQTTGALGAALVAADRL